MAFVRGEDPAMDREVYSESLYPLLHYGWAPLRSVRTDQYKLISAPRPEVYDLVADPREGRDLAAVQPVLLTDLEIRLAELRSTIDIDEGSDAPTPDLDPQTLAQLQALGYAAGQGGVSLDEEEDRPRADPKDRIGVHRTVMRAQTQMRTRPAGRAAGARGSARPGRRGPRRPPDARPARGRGSRLRTRPSGTFGRALEIEPEHRNALQGMASSYRALGRTEEALVGYRRILEIAGADTGASIAIADIEFDRGNLDAAAETLQQAVATSEAPGLISNKLGEVRAEQGRIDEAMALFEEAISKNELFAVPYFNLGVLYEERGRSARGGRPLREGHRAGAEVLSRPVQPRSAVRAPRSDRSATGAVGSRHRIQPRFRARPRLSGQTVDGQRRQPGPGRSPRPARDRARPDQGESGPLGFYVLADILNRTGRSTEAKRAVEAGQQVQAAEELNPDREATVLVRGGPGTAMSSRGFPILLRSPEIVQGVDGAAVGRHGFDGAAIGFSRPRR